MFSMSIRPRKSKLTLQAAMPRDTDFNQTLGADIEGFTLHAAVRGGDEPLRAGATVLIDQPPDIADVRVQCNAAGQVVLKLKPLWRDDTTQRVAAEVHAALVRAGAPGHVGTLDHPGGLPLSGDFVESNRAAGGTATGRQAVFDSPVRAPQSGQ